MFDLEEALSPLNGKPFTFDQLRIELMKIRLEHLAELPPEVGVSELIRIARHRALITEDVNGTMHICTKELA
jgi:hypothetical protein